MSKKEKNVKERFENIDLLKFIAIFMVISLHIPLLNTNFIVTQKYSFLLQYMFRLIFEGVPIFVFVNGFLLINKSFDMNKHIKKIIKVLAIMIIWGGISVIIIALIRKVPLTIWGVIKEILNINISNQYNGVLWFLQNLLGLYIVFPIIKYIHDTNKKLYNYLFITITFFSVGVNLINIISELASTFIKVPGLNYLINNNFYKINPYSNLIFLFYFMLGGYVFEHKDKFNKNIIWSIYGTIAWIFAIIYALAMSYIKNMTYKNNYNYDQIFLAITILGLFSLTTFYVNKKNNIINRFILSVSNNTMGIYLTHNIIINIINYKIILINSLPFFQRLIMTINVFIISWGISYIISKIPKAKNLIKI